MADNSKEIVSQDKKTTVSFGFSKKIGNKLIHKSELGEREEKLEEKDYVKSLEGKKIQSSIAKEEKKILVIPLIKNNNWRLPEKKHEGPKDDDKTSKATEVAPENAGETGADNLDSLAMKELIQDAAKSTQDWKDVKKDSKMVIPLVMQNCIPEGYETDEKLDVSLRPDEAAPADYEQIPVDAYGEAMLRGMGWKPGLPIGNRKTVLEVIEPVLRPKGLGLGADKQLVEKMKNISKNKTCKEEDGLCLVKGAYVLIEKGIHKDLYGKVEGLNEECLRVMVKLALSGQVVDLSQTAIKVVDQREYDKESKIINRSKYNEYKEKEKTRHKEHKGKHKSDSKDKSRHKKRKHSNSSDNEHKSKKSSHHPENLKNGPDCNLKHWVRPLLRVRFIDSKYKEGKYYNSKMVVVDVPSSEAISLKTEDGLLLEDVLPAMLETIIPKHPSGFVMVVTGRNKGQIGSVLRRDKNKYIAVVSLLPDHNIVQLDYNDICEYVGDVEEM